MGGRSDRPTRCGKGGFVFYVEEVHDIAHIERGGSNFLRASVSDGGKGGQREISHFNLDLIS